MGLAVGVFALTSASEFIDPTKPPNYAAKPNGFLATGALTATYIYPSYSVAIINGTSVKVGQNYGQFTIMSISPYSVELRGPQNSKETMFLVAPVKQMHDY